MFHHTSIKAISFIFFTLLFGLGNTAFAQDFGVDFTAGVEKKIVKGLKVGIEGEVRSQDNSSALERLAIGASVSYKPIHYFKIDVGYTFIDKYFEESRTRKDNILDAYWSPRHRVEASLSGILPIGDLELSLRERYQFTHRSEVEVAKWDDDGEKRKDDEIVDAKNEHLWRSRLQIAYHIHAKKMIFTPYGNIELFNNLTNDFKVDKLRFHIGLKYSFKKHHNIEIYYRYNTPIESSSDEDIHLLGLGYTFGF